MFNVRTFATVAVLAASFGTAPALAGKAYHVNARVVDVDPIFETRRINEPYEVCETVPVRARPRGYYRDRYDRPRADAGASVVGGVVGGILGNQLGRGKHRSAFTVLGALAGAAIASEVSEQRRHRPRQQCRVVDSYRSVDELLGYRVTYRYHGREFTQRMDEHPGDWVRVRVRVQPTAT